MILLIIQALSILAWYVIWPTLSAWIVFIPLMIGGAVWTLVIVLYAVFGVAMVKLTASLNK